MPHRLLRQPSPRHGMGVFAATPLARHALVIEYTGERISHAEAERRYAHTEVAGQPGHTFVLELDADRAIDANVGGNDSRYINHSCAPNLEPIKLGDQMWLVALRDIAAGEELGYDYAVELDERHTPARKAQYPCTCGAANCRGSLLRAKGTPWPPEVHAARHAVAQRLRAFIARETDS